MTGPSSANKGSPRPNLDGRRAALADALGSDWTLLESLTQQAKQADFDALVPELYAQLKSRGAIGQAAIFGAMSKGLGDPERMAKLQAFLKTSGLF